jgi:hypothetical protein
VRESTPEFAAFVFPRYNWGNMEDEYRYTLEAWCDGDTCPEYVGDPNDGSRSGRGTDSRYDSRYDSRDSRYSDPDSRYDSRDTRGTRMSWQESSREVLPIRDDGVACQSITVNGTGDARNATLSLTGWHDYPRALRITIGHSRRDVVVQIPQAPQSGDFRIDALPIYGLTGDASGSWKLCVEDTDTRHSDDGEILSWTVGGR